MSNNVGVYVDKFDNCYIYDGEDLCEKDVTKSYCPTLRSWIPYLSVLIYPPNSFVFSIPYTFLHHLLDPSKLTFSKLFVLL